MFGIMKKSCGTSCSTDSKETYRLHYCGTCKTMGSMYGQASRMLLNFDIVFLGELLSSLQGADSSEWQKGFQSHNCFAKVDKEDLPLHLQYTSSVNVFLSELKTNDHIHDSKNPIWRAMGLAFSKPFRKAKKNLANFGLEVEEIQGLFHEQFSIEQEQQSLDEYARPTASITAAIFQQGGKLIHKNDSRLYDLGYQFGKLAYILDAYEDYERDAIRGDFNGIKNSQGLKSDLLQGKEKEGIEKIIFDTQQSISSIISTLDIPEESRQLFSSRMALNIYHKINSTKVEEPSLRTSWKQSKEKVHGKVLEIQQPIKRHLQYAALSLVVFIRPESWDGIRGMDVSQITFATSIMMLLSALACYAGNQKTKLQHQFAILTGKKKKSDACGDCLGNCAGECCTSCCDSMCNDPDCWGNCCDCCSDMECGNGSCCGDNGCSRFAKIAAVILAIAAIAGTIILLVTAA